jgi:DNA-binding IscR family transcriptional regulator
VAGRVGRVLARSKWQRRITIAELAERLKIKPNYLYHLVPGLLSDGKLEKRGKGYHPPHA